MTIYFKPGEVERQVIAKGTPVALRRVQPRDSELLLRGFERLSPESRYRRFFGHKSALSPEEVRYLTDCDGPDHFAIAAVIERPDGSEEGAGVARFIRLPQDPRAAEGSITVIDAFQRRGLGSLLARRLLAAAAEQGVDRLEFLVLSENEPMLVLLRKLGAKVQADARLGGSGVNLAVSTAPWATSGASTAKQISAAAGGRRSRHRAGKPDGPGARPSDPRCEGPDRGRARATNAAGRGRCS